MINKINDGSAALLGVSMSAPDASNRVPELSR
jgi:hypothetical protein